VKKEKKYCGVVIPMITPFDEAGRLDEAAAEMMVERLLQAGTIPFILGTTGEAASISLDLRLQWVKRVTALVPPDTLVYAGISDNCLENTLAMANQFFDLGIRAFVVHLPSYYPLSPEMMLRYYLNLADRCPAPVMIYNIKSTTHMSIPLDVIDVLSGHPNIVGLKDSERDLDRLRALASAYTEREDFSLFSGWTVQSANTLLMGFDGVVPSTGNMIPGPFRQLYDAALRGDKEAALAWQEKIDPLAKYHQDGMLGSEAIVALKVLMNAMGLCGSAVLPPLIRLTPHAENAFVSEARKFGLP
jgi:4-hydroxy-tetrahydrodipicolinate synthase